RILSRRRSRMLIEMITPIETDPRWQAVCDRDAAQDGAFVYAVRTTGVYCRPGCPSRQPKPANVEFFDAPAAAEAAGYRACQRRKPKGAPLGARQAELRAKACRAIEAAEDLPPLERLSEQAGLSSFHFHRVFKAVTGLTPKE